MGLLVIANAEVYKIFFEFINYPHFGLILNVKLLNISYLIFSMPCTDASLGLLLPT